MKFAVLIVAALLSKTTRKWSNKVAAKQSVFKRAVRTVENPFSSSPSKATCSTLRTKASCCGRTSCFSEEVESISHFLGVGEC
jgi:hypothetical protein